MPDRRQSTDTPLGERIRAVEVKLEAVGEKLDKGEEGFDRLRETLESVRQMVSETHSDCLRTKDLTTVESRVTELESFATKAKWRYTIAAGIFAAVLFMLQTFGADRMAQAWTQLWK